jgi:hypothetical protein
VQFQNTSQGATQYNWNFNNQSGTTEPNPQKQFTKTGEQTIQLIAISEKGCRDTAIGVLKIYEDYQRQRDIEAANRKAEQAQRDIEEINYDLRH